MASLGFYGKNKPNPKASTQSSQQRAAHNYAPYNPNPETAYPYMPPPQAQAPTPSNTMLYQSQAQHVHSLPQHTEYHPTHNPYDAPGALHQYHGNHLASHPTFPTPVASHYHPADNPPFTSSYSYSTLPSARAQLTQMSKPTQPDFFRRSASFPAARREPDEPHLHTSAFTEAHLLPETALAEGVHALHVHEHLREGVGPRTTMVNAAQEPIPSPSFQGKSPVSDTKSQTEWVMWVGNVPSNATEEELHSFFNEPSPRRAAEKTGFGEPGNVASVFVISHTNCAFINFKTRHALQSATSRFNGKPLRPHDPLCPRLLCRVRTKEDVLKAGVSAQRGTGIHRKWVKEKMRKQHKVFSGPVSSSRKQHGHGKQRRHGRPVLNPLQHSSGSSGSPATTTSSLLATHFPIRYFILKSLSHGALDLSVEKGIWTTQKHNEEILDKAYRTSKDVYLIFGVNKTGEFYGYGRMASRIQSVHPVLSKEKAEQISRQPLFDPGEHREVLNSPAPMTLQEEANEPTMSSPKSRSLSDEGATAPPELQQAHAKLEHSAKENQNQTAPPKLERVISQVGQAIADSPEQEWTSQPGSIMEPESVGSGSPERRWSEEAGEPHEKSQNESESTVAMQTLNFKVQWICTDRLPFYKIRHIRNSWNFDREIKISRDGTEVDPAAGKQLLEDWRRLGGI